MAKKIKGYKGFNSDMSCLKYQYEVGKEYTQEGAIGCCNNGFHFCENPLDVLGYYPPSTSRYCKVEGSGTIDHNKDKTAVSHIKIKTEIGLYGLINAGVKFILDKVDWKDDAVTNMSGHSAAVNTGEYSAATNMGNRSVATNTGNRSAATNTGKYSAATNTGNRSAAVNTGEYSAAKVEGEESVAITIGYKSKAAGALGCWLVLTERDDNGHILDIKAVNVDGVHIKPNTYYILYNGEIIESK